MTVVKWITWLCLLGFFTALSSAQCHNNPCQQSQFREYTNCIQTSCALSNCQCGNIVCNSCSRSSDCCQKCCPVVNNCNNCQGNNCPSNCPNCNNCQGNNCPSNCPNNCQGNNCPSNCPNNCPNNNCTTPAPCPVTTTTTTRPPRTCADINCETCRGEECMGCCFRITTQQSGRPVTRPPPVNRPCNITPIFKPEIKMPNITITINQPPIHITTGPVHNNISVPCPSPGSVNCPSPNTTVVVVPANGTNCCRVRATRCLPTANPGRPYCYNYYQPVCGPRCQYPLPAPIPRPQPHPQYYPIYIPQPQPRPVYVPQYIPQYVPQYHPCGQYGCEVMGGGVAGAGYYPQQPADCVVQWPHLQCPPENIPYTSGGELPLETINYAQGQVYQPVDHRIATWINGEPGNNKVTPDDNNVDETEDDEEGDK